MEEVSIKLILSNFRKYNNKIFSFNDNLILISGKNGSGKTTILESLNLICKGKSFKNIKNKELIKFNSSFSSIVLDFNSNIYSAWIDKENVKIFKNDVETSFKKIKSELDCFVLNSKHYTLFETSKYERKKFFDNIFSFYSLNYKNQLDIYNEKKLIMNKFLKNPNQINHNFPNLLKEIKTLENILNKFRKKYIEEINKNLAILLDKVDFIFKFNIDYNLVEETNLQNVNNISNKTNLFDYSFFISEKKTNKFFSESINKMVLIIIVLVFIQMYKNKSKINILVLFDDVFSHLDNEKSIQLISLFKMFDLNIILSDQNKIKECLIETLELE